MIEAYYLGAYWGVRKETVDACAQRTVGFLECLTQCDPAFERWFRTGRSRSAALEHEVQLDACNIQKLLLAGRNRTDFGHEILEALGFRISLWNGGSCDEESVGLMIHCGEYAPSPGINSCIINLPYEGEVSRRLLHVSMLLAIMRCIVSAWEPDWGVVTSNIYQRIVPSVPGNAPRMGWIMYLSPRRGPIPALPPPTQVLPLERGGALVVLTDERFTAHDPEQVATAERVTQMLQKEGYLGPLA